LLVEKGKEESRNLKAPPPNLPLEKGEGLIVLRTGFVVNSITIASRE
jgi:hypothetical protein